MTKTEFFALLTAKRDCINDSSEVATRGTRVVIATGGVASIGVSNHRALSTTRTTAIKLAAWFAEWQYAREVEEVKSDAQLDEWANTHDSRKAEAEWIEVDHAEALDINAAIDLMIDERQSVASQEVATDAQLTAMLRRIGEECREVLGEDFDGLKHKAMVLWANGYTPYPVDEDDCYHVEAICNCRQQYVYFYM